MDRDRPADPAPGSLGPPYGCAALFGGSDVVSLDEAFHDLVIDAAEDVGRRVVV
jgi:hypothetical protein